MNDPAPSGVEQSVPPEIAEVVGQATTSVSGVAGLHPGMFGVIGTYLPGRRVPGIRVDENSVEIHVTAVYGSDLSALAAAIRSRVSILTGTRDVNVCVEDVTAASPPSPGR